jgi:hypothetical protein
VDEEVEVVSEVAAVDVEAPSTAGVDVEDTNTVGGAFSMYEPFCCTA